MSIHINRFLDRIKAAESRRANEVSMSISEARDLHNELTRLLLKLQETQESSNTSGASEEINIEIQGGSF